MDDLPVPELAGKIVLDTNNYMVWRDGHFPVVDSGEKTVHELRQEQLPTSKVQGVHPHPGPEPVQILPTGGSSGPARAGGLQ